MTTLYIAYKNDAQHIWPEPYRNLNALPVKHLNYNKWLKFISYLFYQVGNYLLSVKTSLSI